VLDTAFVSHIVEAVYRFHPEDVAPLQRYPFDWRGIFELRDENGQRWVLRLLQHPEGVATFHATATLLDWLYLQQYPVPQIRLTGGHQLVGMRDNWATLLISFIEGTVLTPQPPDLRLLGARLGQLHSLTGPPPPGSRQSRCHPKNIAKRTMAQLYTDSLSVPTAYTPLFIDLHASMQAIIEEEPAIIRVTHGDIWYLNAIKTGTERVDIIDWDNIGVGFPILDLGYLLLSSHFNLDDPLTMKPDEAKVQAIMQGYQQYYRLSRQEKNIMLHAVRFLLAYHLGAYRANQTHLQEDDLFLIKTQERFNSSVTIAQIAETYVE